MEIMEMMGLGDGGNPAARPRHRRHVAACSLVQGDLAARRERWLALCDRALSEKGPTPGGVRLRFAQLPGVKRELEELVTLERDCCSFAAWSVRVEGAKLVLDVSAKGDSVATLRALFDEPEARLG